VGKLFEGEFDLLLGRKTYEIFAAYWPFAAAEDPIHVAFEKAAKFVVTHSDAPLEWQGSHAVAGIDAVRALKATDGPDLVIQGSGTLYPQLFQAGLIDRLTVMTFPVVLGGGKKLFGAGTPPFTMRMVSSQVSATGVTIATYEPAGEVKIGDFAAQEPNPREAARQERMKREG
jgi:dihydrofolate reductase